MKFHPYPVLLTTGALMFATVILAQTDSSVALLKAGAASVDKDVSSFAVKTIASLGDRRLVVRDDVVPTTRVASIDDPE